MEDFYVKLCMICLYTYYVECVLMFCILGKNGCTLFTHLCPLPSTTAKQCLDCDSGLLKCRYLILVQDGIIIEFLNTIVRVYRILGSSDVSDL